MHISPRLPLLVLTAGTMLCTSGVLMADEQKPDVPVPFFQIKGSETLTWDSNPLLLPHGEKPLFGSITTPEVILTSKTPLTNFISDTVVNANIFNQSDFNSNDFHENLNLNRHIEQWGAGIVGRVDYDTTRTSEITTFGLNLPSVRHTGLAATPDIYYQFTSVDKITLAGTVSRSTYNNNAFVDYELFSLNPSYEHRFDPKNKGIFTLNMQRYQSTEGNEIKVDSIGPTIGWQTLLTPRFSIKVDAGVQRAMQNSTLVTPGADNWDYIFDADLAFHGSQDTTDFITSRSQYPFSNGTETLLTAFSVTETHALNQVLSLNAAANYQFAKEPSAAPGSINLDKEYGALGGITYHLLRWMDLTASYQYRNERLTGISGNIDDHTILAGITLHPFN